MYTLALRKHCYFVNFSRDLSRVFFTAVLLAVLALSACETGQDSNSSMPFAGPRSIQVTARDTELVLQWTKVSPAQGVIPSYDVYYSIAANPNGAEKWETAESNTSQLVTSTITGLVNHTTYYLWVKAIYQGLGESDFSPTEYSMPIPPPPAPGTLNITASEQMLEVRWNDVEDAFTYEVNYKAGGSGASPPEDTAETMLTVSAPGAVIFGLTNTTSYTVWVRARNTAGESSYSSGTGSPQAAGSVPASPPGNLTLTPGGKKLTLEWDQVPGVPAYKIYYGTANNISQAAQFPQTIPAAVPTVRADITGLTNGVLYYVWVKSSNSKGESSSASPPASGTPQAKAPINYSDFSFQLGTAAAEYIFAQDLPPSVFFPDGRPNTDRLTRVQETALGNLFCDGAAWYIRTQYPEENIDFVFLNGGYIDNGLSKGTITLGGLSGIVQPDNRTAKFMLLTLTGAELKKFFNDTDGKNSNIEPGDVSGAAHSGRGGPPNTKFFGIVSREVRYTLKYYKAPPLPVPPNFDAEPYQHGFIDTDSSAGALKINGQPIVDSQNYRICTTDELASGAYFVQLYAGKNKRVINTPFWHGAAEYIYDQSSVTPGLDGRIKVEGGVPLPPPWVAGNLIKQ
jgi:fibronectin type 3 domain-containing protein